MDFAEKVKFVRSQLKLSQEDLAHKLGVSFATINRWENGNYQPSRLAKKAFEDYCKENDIVFEVVKWELLGNLLKKNLE